MLRLALFLACFSALFGEKVGYLHIEKDRAIDTSTVLYVQFALDHFRKEGVERVVFDIDTPGGEVLSAVRIGEMLRSFEKPITAYIDNWALSAGALLAYSCPHIVATESASMGAAEPVIAGGGKYEEASEKIKSALRSEFINAAQFWGRNPDLAEAMVDKDIILVWREGIVKLENEDQILFDSDRVITRKGKLLTLNAKQLQQFGVAEEITSDIWQESPFAQAEVVSYDHWKVSFFAFLSHPAVMSLLVMGLFLGFYIEMQNPGLIAPLVVGLSCLSLLTLSHFSLHAVNWLEAIGLAIGLGLIAAEVFLLPGFGVAGILGILLTLGSLAVMTLPKLGKTKFFPEWNLSAIAVTEHLAWFGGALIVAVLLVLFGARRMIQRVALKTTLENEPFFLPEAGIEGVALTPMRPSGKVGVGGNSYEAVSDGLPIEKGAAVTILRHENNKLYVSQKWL